MQTERVTFLTTPDHKAALDAFAASEGKSVGHVLREASSRYIAQGSADEEEQALELLSGSLSRHCPDAGRCAAMRAASPSARCHRGRSAAAEQGGPLLMSVTEAFAVLKDVFTYQDAMKPCVGYGSARQCDRAESRHASLAERVARIEGMIEVLPWRAARRSETGSEARPPQPCRRRDAVDRRQSIDDYRDADGRERDRRAVRPARAGREGVLRRRAEHADRADRAAMTRLADRRVPRARTRRAGSIMSVTKCPTSTKRWPSSKAQGRDGARRAADRRARHADLLRPSRRTMGGVLIEIMETPEGDH